MPISPNRRALLLVASTLLACIPVLARAQADDDDDERAKPVTEVIITAKRLDAARANIEPSLGASTYTLTNDAVENRPGGETTSINQVLLQVPGVQQDGSGQLHVRQSQGGLQYRINNVIIPEGLSDLGESISARIADKVQLVTGALPAQYGFQAGGVVNVTTKNGVYLDGGQVELYGGGPGEIQPAFEYGGSIGQTNLFVSGSFQRSQAGLASVDGSARPQHDRTDQLDGFAYLDRALDDQTRLSLMLGISDDRFQVPNLPSAQLSAIPPGAAWSAPLSVGGVGVVPGTLVDDHYRQAARFEVLSLVHATDRFTVQASAFARQSDLQQEANGRGDLLYRGLAESAATQDQAYGLQVETVYEAATAHTVRAGFLVSGDDLASHADDRVLPLNAAGRQTSDLPLPLAARDTVHTAKASLFVQDEWRLTDSLTLNPGLRFDQAWGQRNDSALSPRFSAVWTAASGLVIHAGYARYFLPARAEAVRPGVAALAGTTGAWPGPQGDPLRPETDDYYDVGLQQTLAGWTLGVDGYWREAHDLIAEGQFGPAHIAESFNYGSARIGGVEFSATYAKGPASAWANLSVASSEARTIVSNPFVFSSGQLAALAARWTPMAQNQSYTISAGGSYHWGPLKVSGDLSYGSGLPSTPVGAALNSASTPAYVQANLAVVYRAAGLNKHPLDLRFDIMNAFDARYVLRDGTGLGDGLAQWGARRGGFVGFEQSF